MNPSMRAAIGFVVCAAYVAKRVSAAGDDAWPHALLLFSALVLVPLAIDLFRDHAESAAAANGFLWLHRVQLPAALLLAVSCWLTPGILAAGVALPWMVLTALMAGIGIMRIRQGGLRRDLDGLCRDVALVYALIGGCWVLADRAGFQPLKFDRAIVTLTAVHFHYAGLLLPLVAGLVQRELFFLRLGSRAAVGVVLGVPAVAAGITATQLGAGASLEAGAGCGLALAGMVVAVLQVRIATEANASIGARVLLGISGVALFIGMVLAGAYAVRGFVSAFPALGIPQMRLLHGTLNAIGFGLCGVLGWRAFALRARNHGTGGSGSRSEV